ncbi:pteridine reductase [Methylomonas montana]|uniref:pteridine reductase n=1 Tax=Methylomonas montana TaxID=3058963 RepID=UPI00265A9CC5|nr:pteridine reductase [Methylomonas montana]WKJ91108.1 pteridine reductase [Methylomonas montana]
MSRVALVTGAAKRIGAACVRGLHAAGFNVVLHYHSADREASLLSDELNALRADSLFPIKANLLQMDQVQHLAIEAQDVWGGIDVLVNNASSFFPGSIGQVDERDWDSLVGSNLKAPFFLSQALAPSLSERRGCIVNIVDIHAETGLPRYPVYSITKAGLVAMTRCLAKEMAPDVRVNAVAPGAILWPAQDAGAEGQLEILKKVALQRCGSADDVAKAVKFLVEDADYITGQVITVDGGRTLFR